MTCLRKEDSKTSFLLIYAIGFYLEQKNRIYEKNLHFHISLFFRNFHLHVLCHIFSFYVSLIKFPIL